MQAAGARAYLVNTGWNGSGRRIAIRDTRAIIDAILSDETDSAEAFTLPVFSLRVPVALSHVSADILDPRATYHSSAQWEEKARSLAERFRVNFARYTDNPAGKALVSAGPAITP